jgi:hypothetical protein
MMNRNGLRVQGTSNFADGVVLNSVFSALEPTLVFLMFDLSRENILRTL